MRPLLLTLDAFNTLFHPRHPIPAQYAASAAAFNIPITPSALQPAFKSAFKAQSRSHPNYGRDLALRGEYGGPRQWWEDVIRGSFARALAESSSSDSNAKTTEIPNGLVVDLLDRFASARGYKLYDDVRPFFERLHEMQRKGTSRRRVIIGVVSNSDDRVCSVLESLGVSVGETRAGERGGHKLPGFEEERERTGTPQPNTRDSVSPLQGQGQTDVDFVLTSYQAGAEKPAPYVWDTALRTAQVLTDDAVGNEGGWECVHVGDDFGKDYRGAVDAGWKAYYLPRDPQAAANAQEGTKTITSLLDLVTELGAFK
ncbi:HAD-like domain-containing protein [Aspergillus carlsbadensis]|nr:HAD-like domain-containing protein [Aspergillus carlsbadensis]